MTSERVVIVTAAGRGMGAAIARELAAKGYAADNIRMNSILPGFIDSLPHGEDKSAGVPMRRIGSMAEIAKTAAFLLGDGAGYITGQNLRVDGGLTRGV